MKRMFLIIAMNILFNVIKAQDVKVATINFGGNVPAAAAAPVAFKLDETQVLRFKGNTNDKIIIEVQNPPGAGATLELADGTTLTTEAAVSYFNITAAIKDAINKALPTPRPFKVQVTPAAGPLLSYQVINVEWDKLPDDKGVAGIKARNEGKANRDKIIAKFKARSSFSIPYNHKKNRVDLYFNEAGRLLNYLPVNVDQNDVFYIHIVCEKGDEEKYRVNITEGEFAPSDLAIRPFSNIEDAATSSGSGKKEGEEIPKEYIDITLQAGPFTTDNFKFQIAYDSADIEKNGPEYSLKINKLFHVGVGVSMISSSLTAPDYRTYFNGTTNTIKAFNEGRRTLFTFNVIWYWTILQQKSQGSVIPDGRDVLKDEPTFSLKRLYPTVGVTLDNKFKENFFIGGVYEFARGGSIIAGLHYGKVDRLADKNFELEKTEFTGTDADIKLNSSYKPGFFIGINLDTRILNVLFGRGQQQPSN